MTPVWNRGYDNPPEIGTAVKHEDSAVFLDVPVPHTMAGGMPPGTQLELIEAELSLSFFHFIYWGGPLQYVKIGGGGTKYQEGCHTRTTSMAESHCLC